MTNPVPPAPEPLIAAPEPAIAAPEPARGRRFGSLQMALAAVAILAGAALFLSGFSLGARTATTPGTPADDAARFAPFWDVYESITKSYVGDVDRDKLVQGAIDGMVGALDDPYSAYMSPDELRKARESIGGEFSGVGAEVTTRPTDSATGTCATIGPSCRLVVVAPIDGSPAERAEIRAGDVITAVDGRTVDGETLDEAIARVRGPRGSTVTLTLVRGGGARPSEVPIARARSASRQFGRRDPAAVQPRTSASPHSRITRRASSRRRSGRPASRASRSSS
jgi:C-terminal processing protease CtpA/Prc